ncbi:3720_t:CDS:1, partial [Funneliformis geosporum]
EKTWKRRDMSAKLEAQWIGPYYIHDIIGFNNYKLRSIERRIVKGTIHRDCLKLYNEQEMEPMIIIT